MSVQSGRRHRLVKIAFFLAALFVAAGLSWLSVQNTLGWISPPGLANTALVDDNGKAIGDEAYLAFQRDDLTRAKRLAVEALSISPASVSALRTLALISEANGEIADAAELMELSQRLSRRDVKTQIWLLTRGIQEGDFEKALVHFNVALTTSPGSKKLLFPVLSATVFDPNLRRLVQETLANDPLWRDDFLSYLIGQAGPVPDVFALVVPVLDPTDERDQYEIRHFLGRLVQEQRFELAWQLYAQSVQQSGQTTTFLRNGNFESANLYPYFEWTFTKGDSLVAEQAEIGDARQDPVGVIFAGSRGIALRQMLLLDPGGYILTFRSYTPTDNNLLAPRVRVVCKSGFDDVLGEAPFSLGEARDARIRIHVPKGCSAQQLEVFVRSAIENDAPSWIDDVVLRRQ